MFIYEEKTSVVPMYVGVIPTLQQKSDILLSCPYVCRGDSDGQLALIDVLQLSLRMYG